MIQLIDFNDKWKEYFLKEKEILLNVLRGQKVMEVEHVGATSVVMCKTCGTIDLMCTVFSKLEFETVRNLLCGNGYQFLQSLSNEDCYTFGRRNNKNHIVSTVRVVEQASKIHQELILFKAYLREREKHVRSYNQFRRTLLESCNGDAKEYQKVKKNYIESILHDFCEVS